MRFCGALGVAANVETPRLLELALLPAGSYDFDALCAHRMVHKGRPVKVLGKGTLTKKFTLTVHAVSKSAKKAVEKAGGTITIAKR